VQIQFFQQLHPQVEAEEVRKLLQMPQMEVQVVVQQVVFQVEEQQEQEILLQLVRHKVIQEV
tara:strand:- start:279 stop:464 length:186 start_codon:yes stop_codon:yes gene_type:complete